MWRQEWDFWTGEPDLSSLAIPEHLRQVLLEYPKNCLSPIEDRMALIDEEIDIVPGIRLLKAPGHTPGHIALSITSRGERLYDLVDTAIHPIQLEHPEWYAAVDSLPDETVKTRRRLLRMAAEGGALVKLFHFPFPGLGRVVDTNSGWKWRSGLLVGEGPPSAHRTAIESADPSC